MSSTAHSNVAVPEQVIAAVAEIIAFLEGQVGGRKEEEDEEEKEEDKNENKKEEAGRGTSHGASEPTSSFADTLATEHFEAREVEGQPQRHPSAHIERRVYEDLV